jgi:hypothetical protein
MAAIARLRTPYAPPIARRRTRVGEEPETKLGSWMPIFTHTSLDSVAKHMSIPVGTVITFAAQFGDKDTEDESDSVHVRARVTAAREPFSTDDLVYNATLLDVIDTYDLHPGVPLPSSGASFVLSPNHVETIDALATPTVPTPAPPPPPPVAEKPAAPAKAPDPALASSSSAAAVPWWAWVLGGLAVVGLGAALVLK